MFRGIKSVLIGLALATVAGSAMAMGDKAIAKAVKARKAHMQIYAFNMGQLAGMAKGKTPYDADKATIAATNLNLAAMMKNGAMWPKGSDNAALGDKTRALPKIWEASSGVGQKSKKFKTAVTALAEAAGKGQTALASSFGPVGKACGGCHKGFRAPKKK